MSTIAPCIKCSISYRLIIYVVYMINALMLFNITFNVFKQFCIFSENNVFPCVEYAVFAEMSYAAIYLFI